MVLFYRKKQILFSYSPYKHREEDSDEILEYTKFALNIGTP